MNKKSRLEIEVESMEKSFFERFPMKTIAERAADDLIFKISTARIIFNEELDRFTSAQKRLNFMLEQYHFAMRILAGEEGYYLCSQHDDSLPQSGFTSFEEVVENVGEMFVKVSLTELRATFGTYVFKIESNGMMNLFDKNVDSSD